MGHHRQRRILAATVAVLGLVSIASAQVADGGKTLRLTLGQTLEYSDNIELVAEPPQNTLRYSTRLGIDYRDITRTQELRFSTNANFETDNNDTSEISDPFASLSYAREGANSRFSFSADYRRTDLDDVSLPLELLFPGVELPDEIVDNVAVIETGIRTDTSYALEIETGLQSLVGFRLDLSARDRRYDELQVFDLAENRFLRGEAELTFRIDPALTARVLANVRETKSEDDEQSRRQQSYWGAGLVSDVAPGTQVDVLLARQTIKREDNDINETDGLRASVALTHALPNGEIGTNF